jgi:metal-sulfur cluster biosynthetic enzyme
MQSDLLAALNEIEDPELGIGLVDLGLVYRADWSETGIDVEFTMTSPSCPFAESLLEQVEAILQQRFGEATSIRVRLVSSPPWSAERMTEAAKQKLGWSRAPQAPSAPARSGRRFFGLWKH